MNDDFKFVIVFLKLVKLYVEIFGVQGLMDDFVSFFVEDVIYRF